MRIPLLWRTSNSRQWTAGWRGRYEYDGFIDHLHDGTFMAIIIMSDLPQSKATLGAAQVWCAEMIGQLEQAGQGCVITPKLEWEMAAGSWTATWNTGHHRYITPIFPNENGTYVPKILYPGSRVRHQTLSHAQAWYEQEIERLEHFAAG